MRWNCLGIVKTLRSDSFLASDLIHVFIPLNSPLGWLISAAQP